MRAALAVSISFFIVLLPFASFSALTLLSVLILRFILVFLILL